MVIASQFIQYNLNESTGAWPGLIDEFVELFASSNKFQDWAEKWLNESMALRITNQVEIKLFWSLGIWLKMMDHNVFCVLLWKTKHSLSVVSRFRLRI